MVLRRDMSFAGFWKWYSCFWEEWGVVSWVVVVEGEMMFFGEGIRMLGEYGILDLGDVIWG